MRQENKDFRPLCHSKGTLKIGELYVSGPGQKSVMFDLRVNHVKEEGVQLSEGHLRTKVDERSWESLKKKYVIRVQTSKIDIFQPDYPR